MKSIQKIIGLLFSIYVVSVVTVSGQKMRPLKGKPIEVQLTPYKTTFLAGGKDSALISVKIIDEGGATVKNAERNITFHIKGDATIKRIYGNGVTVIKRTDTLWEANVKENCEVVLLSGKSKSVISFDAKSEGLYTGSTSIHSIVAERPVLVTSQKYIPRKTNDKILGADISFLPELESKGMKFSDNGVEKDAIQILKDHGFNYIRLRIFNDPANDKGYSPGQGFCDLEHTKQMAKRVKAAGMKLLLDFHYSDYWADPGHEYKPREWEGQDFKTLQKSLHDYTLMVMNALKEQGTVPEMVQIGNEINHGMVWPDGAIANIDNLAKLIYEGERAVKEVNKNTLVMVHLALGGQNAECRYFLDHMASMNVPFDIIGLSYYPKWHGTLADLKFNINDLAKRYKKQISVVEYTHLKKEVNDIAFRVVDHKGIGTFIWEPLSTWEMIFDRSGKSNDLIKVYDVIAKEYKVRQ